MNQKTYQVIGSFDLSKDYGIHIQKGIAKTLSLLTVGNTICSTEFTKKYPEVVNLDAQPISNTKHMSAALSVGAKIGILTLVEFHKVPYKSFCKLDSIQYMNSQLRGPQYKHLTPLDPSGLSSTQRTYTYALYKFSNWFEGKQFEFTRYVQTGLEIYTKTREKVTFEGLEDLLHLYRDSSQSESDFARLIKTYLNDPIHANKSAKGIKVDCAAIIAYFEKNDFPIHFKFDAKVKYQFNEDVKSLSLEDLLQMLTVGRPTITQKAVILCKFHRGLDNSTLCDRFNFEAYSQLATYFGTEQYLKWDLSKCPVPIKLTRMKTRFPHVGFLDRDAIEALQKYLDYRHKKTGEPMHDGQPMFLNSKNQPIREKWVRTSFFRLATTAGIQKRINRVGAIRYEKDSHETRDLIKSTLLDCGCREDVADHCIGHKPKDSYDKQALLYPESMRKEYSKASKRLNLFSNLSSFIRGAENIDEMQDKIISLETNMVKITKRLEWAEKTRRKN